MKTKVLWLAVCVLVSGHLGAPASVEASRCAVAQYGAAAKNVQMKAACRAKAAKRGEALDPDCTSKADAVLAKKWEKAQRLNDCAKPTSTDEIADLADGFTRDLRNRLEGFFCESHDDCRAEVVQCDGSRKGHPAIRQARINWQTIPQMRESWCADLSGSACC